MDKPGPVLAECLGDGQLRDSRTLPDGSQPGWYDVALTLTVRNSTLFQTKVCPFVSRTSYGPVALVAIWCFRWSLRM